MPRQPQQPCGRAVSQPREDASAAARPNDESQTQKNAQTRDVWREPSTLRGKRKRRPIAIQQRDARHGARPTRGARGCARLARARGAARHRRRRAVPRVGHGGPRRVSNPPRGARAVRARGDGRPARPRAKAVRQPPDRARHGARGVQARRATHPPRSKRASRRRRRVHVRARLRAAEARRAQVRRRRLRCPRRRRVYPRHGEGSTRPMGRGRTRL